MSGQEGFRLPAHYDDHEDAAVPDAPEPGPGEWRFGRRMEEPRLELPFPLTREAFQACLPQVGGSRGLPARPGMAGCMPVQALMRLGGKRVECA